MIYGITAPHKGDSKGAESDNEQDGSGGRPGMNRESSNFGGGHGGFSRGEMGMNRDMSEDVCTWNYIHFSKK